MKIQKVATVPRSPIKSRYWEVVQEASAVSCQPSAQAAVLPLGQVLKRRGYPVPE
ncbi:MAG: hypothetical protein ACP5D7_01590 [Limnospira sp.]